MAATPGGLCTSWRRKGYLFDGSMAAIVGISPQNPLHSLWKSVGVIDHCDFYQSENFGYIVLPRGDVITLHADADKLESHLLENFPGERRVIRTLIKAIRAFSDFEMPQAFGSGTGLKKQLWDSFALAKHIPSLLKYGNLSIEALCKKTAHADLARTLRHFVHFGGSAVPLLSITLPLAYADKGDVGMPRSGWLEFSQAMAKRFRDLGGTIEYGAKVNELIVEDKRVRGVAPTGGAKYAGERILTAIDGYYLDTHLLRELSQDELEKRYAPQTISEQPVQINIGVALDFADMRGPVTHFVEPEAEIVDVSTPLTRKRYTGNFMGAIQARAPDAAIMKSLMSAKPAYRHKTIRGLYM